jgi:hypothetical protein
MSITNCVAGFGKVIFIPAAESVPPLPDMNLLVFKEENRGNIFPWRMACIDLEIDAAGNSMDEAWENLKKSLTMYIEMEKKAAGGSITEAAKNIIMAAFEESSQKKEYISLYRQAKLEFTIQAITSGKISDPIEEEKRRIKKLESDHDLIRSIVNELKAA